MANKKHQRKTEEEDRKHKSVTYYEKQIVQEGTGSSYVRLLEAFLEAGPQLVLQLYIMLKAHQDIFLGNINGK